MPVTGVVSNIVDGDTIDVLIGGQEFRVRYIGINTPETDELFGSQATEQNRLLVSGQEVTLYKDVSETDQYGRLLRYVFVGDLFVNYELVRRGYAQVASYPPDTACISTFQTAQAEARNSRAGLWAQPASTNTPIPSNNGGGATCSCTGPDLDCGNFDTHAEAQSCYEYCNSQGYGDVHRLDGDDDGSACESLP
jgi:micrococcal nuclease